MWSKKNKNTKKTEEGYKKNLMDVKYIDNTLNVPEKWDDTEIDIQINKGRNKKKVNFSFKIFLFSFLIFIFAGGFVFFSFFNNRDIFSENKILVFSVGPGSITSGENGKIDVSVTNNNNSPITDSYLTLSYDSGENYNGQKNIINKKIDIGIILSKQTITKSFDFSIFGGEGAIQDFKPEFHYKIPNAKAEFLKESNQISTVLKSSPVSINVINLSEVHIGYDATFKILVRNNTDKDIEDLIVSVRNPNNFILGTSSLPLFSNSPSWKLYILPANSEKEISFTGKITGNIGENATFTFYTGISNTNSSSTSNSNLATTSSFLDQNIKNVNIDNIYSMIEKSIKITGQYLNLTMSLENSINTNIDKVSPGQVVNLKFTYSNNLKYPVDNISINLFLAGGGVDVNNINPSNGIFNYQNMSVVWDKNSLPSLSRLSPGGSGEVKLYFRVSDKAKNGDIVRLTGYIVGDRNGEDNVSNIQDISIDKTWTVSSN